MRAPGVPACHQTSPRPASLGAWTTPSRHHPSRCCDGVVEAQCCTDRAARSSGSDHLRRFDDTARLDDAQGIEAEPLTLLVAKVLVDTSSVAQLRGDELPLRI